MDWKILIALIGALAVFFLAKQCADEDKPDFDKTRQDAVAEQQSKLNLEKETAAWKAKEVHLEVSRKTRGERAEAVLATLETEEFKAVFSTHGGVLKSLTLKNPQYVESPRDWTTGLRNEETEDFVPVDMVTTNTKAFELSAPLRFKVYESKGLEALLPDADYKIEQQTKNSVRFRLDQPGLPVTIVKKFELDEKSQPFQLWLTIRVTNHSDSQVSFRSGVIQHGYQHETEATGSIFSKQPNLLNGYCYYGDELAAFPWNDDDLATPFSGIGQIGFVGVGTNYFLAAMVPSSETKASCYLANVLDNRGLYPTPEAQPWGHITAELRFAEVDLSPGESKAFQIKNYLGPKRFRLLQSLGNSVEKSVDFGWFAPICQVLLSMLFFFQGVFGNWGVSIILLTVVVKMVLMPLTHRSFKSAEKMKALKPEVDKINEKFKDNAQEKQAAIMALYKQQGVNPLGGCLPTLLQMPIWFGLFRMLRASPELYRAPFFGWIQDLSSPDPYFVTPIVMGAAMFIQQRFTPMTGDAAQAKMMLYFMPIMFTGMMLFLPSGLTLYILVNTVLSIAHQMYIHGRSAKGQPGAGIKARRA
jgi:YidC/Oxa1 family membrane protein insertase